MKVFSCLVGSSFLPVISSPLLSTNVSQFLLLLSGRSLSLLCRKSKLESRVLVVVVIVADASLVVVEFK